MFNTSSSFIRQDVIGTKNSNGTYTLSGLDMKNINDMFMGLFYTVYGNISGGNLKDNSVGYDQIKDEVHIDIETAMDDGSYAKTQVGIQQGEIDARVTQGDFNSYVDMTAQEISSKVSSTDFNDYQNQVTGDLSNKVDNSVFDTYKTDAGTDIDSRVLKIDFQSYQDQTSSEISSKVDATVYEQFTSDTNDALNGKVAVSDYNSYVSQTATTISQKVACTDYTGNTIASLINQTYKTISINAIDVDLTGYVTFSALSGSGTTTINGANITTGTIRTNVLEPYTDNVLNFANGASLDCTGGYPRIRYNQGTYTQVYYNGLWVYVTGDAGCGIGGIDTGGVFVVDSNGTKRYAFVRN